MSTINFSPLMNDKAVNQYEKVIRKYARYEDVLRTAKAFLVTWHDNLDSIDACETIRRLFSDALREAGCDNVFVHHYILNFYGHMAAETVLDEYYGMMVDWHGMKLVHGVIDFDDEVLRNKFSWR